MAKKSTKKTASTKPIEPTLWQNAGVSAKRVIYPGSQLFYLGWFIVVAGLIVSGVFLLAPLFLL